MATKLFLKLESSQFVELESELRRLADECKKAAKIVAETKETLHIEGLNKVVQGMESLINVLGYVCGKPSVGSLRLPKTIGLLEKQREANSQVAEKIAKKALRDSTDGSTLPQESKSTGQAKTRRPAASRKKSQEN